LDTCHGVQELGEPPWIIIERRKSIVAIALFDFALRQARAQGFSQISPKMVEPIISHFQYAADIASTCRNQKRRRVGGVSVTGAGAIAFPG